MKFMMIFEAVDKATKVMSKIMGAEKKAAAAMKAGANSSAKATQTAAKATEKQASVLAKVAAAARSAYRGVVAGAQAAGRATAALHRQTVALAVTGFGQLRSGAGKVFRGLTVAAGLATAAFGTSALAANHLLETATKFESFRIQLETLEGSAAKGKQALAWITQFAVATPLELDQVVESYRNLRTFGIDPTNGSLMSLVDTMAASGKGVEHLDGLVLALGQAWTKEKLQGEEALQLLERGVPVWEILSQKYGKTAAELQEMASKGKLGREAIQYLIEEMGRRNSGASEKMSKTWEGMIGNLMDTWLQFKLAIMDAGLFDWMKGKLQLVLDTVNKMSADGSLQKWAADVSDRIMFVLEQAWIFGEAVGRVMKELGVYLQMAADYVGGWENLAKILATIAFAPTLISTAAGLVQIAMGLSMLGAALMANPIMLAIAAIVAGAALIYMKWEPIKTFFVGIWNSIAGAAQAAWDKIKSWIGFDPVPILAAIWDAHKVLGAMALDVLPALISTAWESIKAVFSWSPSDALGKVWSGISLVVMLHVDAAFAAVDAVWSRIKAVFDWSPVEAIKAAWAGISDAVGGMIDGAFERASSAWGKVKSLFTFGDGAAAAVTVTDPATIRAAAEATAGLKADMEAVAAIDTGPAMSRLAALEQSARQIGTTVTAAVRQAEAFLAGVSFYSQGAALMDTMAAGMRARAAVVVQEIQKMTQTIRDHLPSSPAKIGPLSDIHRLKFGETIAGSIRAEPMVKAMRTAAAATMAAASISGVATAGTGTDAARSEVARVQASRDQAVGSGGGINLTFSPSMTISGNGSASDIRKEIEAALPGMSRQLMALIEEQLRLQKRKEY